MRKVVCDVTLSGSGRSTRRNIGRTVGALDVVTPTANHENSLKKAGALSKIIDPGLPEGPWREAVVTVFIACYLHLSCLYTLEWLWSMRQLYINNLHTVITGLHSMDRAGFEHRSSGSKSWLDTNRLTRLHCSKRGHTLFNFKPME